MPGWSSATITQNDVVGPGLHRLSLDVAPRVARSFHAPGQYHRVRVPSGEDATFAIGSAPGAERFEYLVRASEGPAGQWTSLPVGSLVDVGLPDGPGFPLEKALGKNVVLIGTGTGFSPLRSVLHTIRPQRASFGLVSGAYGVLTPAHLAFAPELAGWAADRMHVVPTVTTSAPGWAGAVGQVQALVPSLPLEDAIAFLCGQNEMLREVTLLLEQHGLPPERVFLNFPV